MIKLTDLDQEVMVKLLSAVFSENTTKETYVYIRQLFDIIPPQECIDVMYLIFSAVESLYEVHSISRNVPLITKASVIAIIENNIYGELKENEHQGFKQYASRELAEELDRYQEASLLKISKVLVSRCEEVIDSSTNLGYTVEQSLASIPEFINMYGQKFAGELGSLIAMFNNSDSASARNNYWGWSSFLWKHRINHISHLSRLLQLSAAFYEGKVVLASKGTIPLTEVGQVLAMEEYFKNTSVPIGLWEIPSLDDILSLRCHEVTFLVGEKGLGKTKLGSFLAATLLAQGKKVLFYCPELMKHQLLFNFILPSYVKAKYGFYVTAEQLVGFEEPYQEGEYTPAEKRRLIDLAKLELADSGLFYHVDRHFTHERLRDELRSEIVKFSPDFIVFDHTLEIRGGAGLNEKTQNLADVLEDIKMEFPVNIIALSHTGSEFRKPTKETPIITSKIVAWSARLEGIADNIVGMFRSEGNCINLFFTKLRWAALIPMYLVFRMDPKHGWFMFREEDQIFSRGSTLNIDALSSVYEGLNNYEEKFDDEDEEGFEIL